MNRHQAADNLDGRIREVDDAHALLVFLFTLLKYPPLIGKVNVPCFNDQRFLWAAPGLPGDNQEVSEVRIGAQAKNLVEFVLRHDYFAFATPGLPHVGKR